MSQIVFLIVSSVCDGLIMYGVVRFALYLEHRAELKDVKQIKDYILYGGTKQHL